MAENDNAGLEPFPTNPELFDLDERVSYDKVNASYVLEAENGTEWEWLAGADKWVPVVRTSQTPCHSPHRKWQALACVETAAACWSRFLTSFSQSADE
jgi:hypothetical protein